MGKVERYEVYSVRDTVGVVAYVGQGKIGRAASFLMPCRYRNLGLYKKPTVIVHDRVSTRKKAIQLENFMIAFLHPIKNKALWSSAGGLRPWNFGLHGNPCRGGRPRGIPMSKLTKKRLSRAMKGKATRWMSGRPAWNKGLTKKDHPSIAKAARQMRGNFRGYRQ